MRRSREAKDEKRGFGAAKIQPEQRNPRNQMAENKQISSDGDLNAKWDACLDLSLRRVVYTSVAGAFGGLLLFRSPVTRWASVAFGAGVGFGSAYSDCSQLFNGRAPRAACRHSKFVKPSVVSHPPEVSNSSVSEDTTQA